MAWSLRARVCGCAAWRRRCARCRAPNFARVPHAVLADAYNTTAAQVELARGGRDRFFDDRGPPPPLRERGYGDRDRGADDYRPRPRYDDRYGDDPRRGGPPRSLGPAPYGPSRKTDYAVELSGLLPEMSWQDVKDYFRDNRFEVTHADVRFRWRPRAPRLRARLLAPVFVLCDVDASSARS